MRAAALGSGKRMRPLLVVASCDLFNVDRERAMRVALAIEAVHVYSLVHDDLPCMDDDDLRRGKPTVHKAYDEATAILVGDALQTLAFEIGDADLQAQLSEAARDGQTDAAAPAGHQDRAALECCGHGVLSGVGRVSAGALDSRGTRVNRVASGRHAKR